MLSLRKRRIITSTLKFRHRDTRRVKWWLKDESLIPVARSVVAAIRDITNQTAPSNGGIIKLNERKIVFRIKHPQDAAQSTPSQNGDRKPGEVVGPGESI